METHNSSRTTTNFFTRIHLLYTVKATKLRCLPMIARIIGSIIFFRNFLSSFSCPALITGHVPSILLGQDHNAPDDPPQWRSHPLSTP
mmetsp:Transcript_23/g.106  ORF Transcript_23/g.106 Transcript_23/m.106 type:complete len:88 (-) Transcript_23:1331-1594(-)